MFLHDIAIKKYGGSPGIRDITLLHSATGRPSTSFENKDLYPTIFDKAAALLQSILKNHPFIDGNKRAALLSATTFLRINGYKLINTHLEEVEFTVSVDTKNLPIDQISKWLKEYSIKIRQ
ncbi:type II toxin-antitoxin system death-on-curing family toxin [Candidatus Daviesbacteria bacterium]|nr:type II toxin-antitoxin system death-on-curing family toxin [Candidatus Daviesbacteria bacterium]